MKTVIITLFLLSTIQSARATITVTTDFDPAPVKTILENQAHEGNVAFTFTVKASPTVSCDFTYTNSAELRFEGTGGANGSPAQGTAYFARTFDYELTPNIQSVMTVMAPCSPSEQTTKSIQIILQDVNDNVPYFELSTIIANKTENVGDLLVTTLRAKDFDKSTQYNTDSLEFSIQNDYPGMFNLNDLGKVDDWYTIQLVLTQALDYEQMVFYRVTVVVQDCKGGCSPKLSGEAVVIISVNDAPDQKPIFTQYVPYVEISENSIAGTSVAKVTAVDGDRAINQPIQYTLTDESGWYKIDENTGKITVSIPPDREHPSYQVGTTISIVASELGDPASATSIEMTIRLTDVDDIPPTFSSPTYTGGVIETATIGFPITMAGPQLQVYDLDEGDNAKFKLRIVEQNAPFKVNLDEGEGTINFVILVNGELDFETKPIHTITVHAEDAQNPSTTATAIVTINLVNANDRPPDFSVTETSCTPTLEDAPKDTTVCTVKATDVDGDEFGPIVYTVTGSIATSLKIDQATGIITLDQVGVLDFEKYQSYSLTVQARDENGNGLSSTMNLELEILDANDVSPEFLHATYADLITENSPNFIVPLTVMATDKDTGINSEITYSIDETGLGAQFQITDDGEGGGIVALKEGVTLDYEKLVTDGVCDDTKCQFSINVLATDGGLPPNTDTTVVTITVQDVNDVPPKFEQDTYTGNVPENANEGDVVTQVKAIDADGTQNSKIVTYRIDSGGDQQFRVNPTSGEVTVSPGAYLDIDIDNQYDILISANDGVNSDTCTVTVTITDVNNKAPVFTDREPTANCTEESTGVIKTLEALDLDENDQLEYGINFEESEAREPSGQTVDPAVAKLDTLFSIDKISGEVSAIANVDREIMKYVTLVIAVKDANALPGITQTDTVNLEITVVDINDNPPQFNDNEYYAQVKENRNKDTAINVVTVATDVDEDSVVIYSLNSSQGDNSYFYIPDETTGKLFVFREDIDFETTSELTAVVIASNPNSVLANSVNVIITVTDENDNIPQFTGSLPYNFIIAENDEKATFQVTATDADSPNDQDDLCYEIYSENSPNTFGIQRETGIISVLNVDKLDYEKQEELGYDLIVQVFDSCNVVGEKKTATAQVTVTLTDINDNPPDIDEQIAPKEVSEIEDIDAIVYSVVATDKDEDGQQKLSYTMAWISDGGVNDGSDYFAIDPNTGEIKVTASLLDKIQYFNFTVTVTDVPEIQGQSKSSDTVVALRIKDENTNTPIIYSPDPSFTIPLNESELAGYEVFDVDASDADTDPENRRITYEFGDSTDPNSDPENIKNTLKIDPDSGVVTLVSHVDKKNISSYSLNVIARDHGVPQKSSSAIFTIVVINADDAEPVFVTTDYPLVLFSENTTSQQQQLYKALDPDEGTGLPPRPIYYYLVGPIRITDYFALDVNTNVLTPFSKTSLDHEDLPNAYNLTVDYITVCIRASNNELDITPSDNVCDDDRNTNTSYLEVHVKIGDVNDNPPNFLYAAYQSFIINGHNYESTVVLWTSATDLDDVDANMLTYSIQKVTLLDGHENMQNVPLTIFQISPTDGTVTVSYNFENSMTGVFQLDLLVEDSERKHSGTAIAQVTVVESDQRPKYFQMDYAANNQ